MAFGIPTTVSLRNIILVVLVFAPGTSTVFTSLAPVTGLTLIALLRGNISRNLVMVLVWLVGLSLIVIMLRGVLGISTINFRDITEIMRLVALLAVIVLSLGTIEAEFGRRAIWVMLLMDLVLSLSQLQILPSVIANMIGDLYQSDFHIENTLGISKRALGMYTDPTTHGLAIGLVALFFLSEAMAGKGRVAIVGLIISVFLVALAQSQTAFIATVLGICTFFASHLLTRPTLRSFVMFGVLIGGVMSSLIRFAEELSYLFLLFKVGLARNSFQRRIEKRDDSIEAMHDEPAGVILGWGKDYLGSASAALDNEYLFVYLVYGLPGLFIFVCLLVWIVIQALRYKAHLPLAATVFGIVAAYPASFFTNLKTFVLYCLVINLTITAHHLPAFIKRLR